MEYLEGMLQKEKDNFSRVCNRLLGTCFLCKGNQNTKADYYFVLKYRKEFKEYLGVLGYRLEINEEYGVIQLTSPRGYNRMNLKLYDSIVLLILRILYDEKKRELSAIEEVIVNLGDIQDKFVSLNIRDRLIDKTTMRNALSLFRRYQIVELLDPLRRLAVEGVIAGVDAVVDAAAQAGLHLPGGIDEDPGEVEVGHRRETVGHIEPGGALVLHGAGGDHQVADLQLGL